MLPLGPQQEARRSINRVHSSPQELLKRGCEVISRPDLNGDESHAETCRHQLRGLSLPGVRPLAGISKQADPFSLRHDFSQDLQKFSRQTFEGDDHARDIAPRLGKAGNKTDTYWIG